MSLRLNLDALAHPGQRQPVFAPNGVVATSQPLASQAGLAVLRHAGAGQEVGDLVLDALG